MVKSKRIGFVCFFAICLLLTSFGCAIFFYMENRRMSEGYCDIVLFLLDSDRSSFNEKDLDSVLTISSVHEMRGTHFNDVLYGVLHGYPEYIDNGRSENIRFLEKRLGDNFELFRDK